MTITAPTRQLTVFAQRNGTNGSLNFPLSVRGPIMAIASLCDVTVVGCSAASMNGAQQKPRGPVGRMQVALVTAVDHQEWKSSKPRTARLLRCNLRDAPLLLVASLISAGDPHLNVRRFARQLNLAM